MSSACVRTLREASMGIVLRVTSGPHTGQEFLVDRRETFTVGRSSRVQFPMVDDLALSREHFQVDNEPPLCHLVDLGSTNGTKVNGLRVGRVLLARRRRDHRGRQHVLGPLHRGLQGRSQVRHLCGLWRADPYRLDRNGSGRARSCRTRRSPTSGFAATVRRAASSFPRPIPTT